MIKVIVGIFTALAVLILLPALPWPALPAGVFTAIGQAIGYGWMYNAYVPVDTLLSVAAVITTIEFTSWAVRMLGRIMRVITGHPNPAEFIDATGGSMPKTNLPL